jgi:transcription antitermination factor NusG
VAYQVGDKIKVVQGELKGLTGEVIEIKERVVKFKPFSETITFPLQLDQSEVQKYFLPG